MSRAGVLGEVTLTVKAGADIVTGAAIALPAELPLAVPIRSRTLGSKMSGIRNTTDSRDGSSGLPSRVGKLEE